MNLLRLRFAGLKQSICVCLLVAALPSFAATPPATTLSCDGFPQPVLVSINGTLQTYTKVCLILQEDAAVTPNVSVTTNIGDVTAHGGAASDTYVAYARVVAQAANEGAATALAKSVVVTTSAGTITASPDHVDYPQSLEVDFEVFTASSTNVTLSSSAGDLAADNYNATLKTTALAGDTALENVQGQVTANTNIGDITVKVTGAGWSGSGLTATVGAGDVTLLHPAGYQAAFTAQSSLGTAAVDGKTATAGFPGRPATVTAGSGPPLVLKTMAGDARVSVAR